MPLVCPSPTCFNTVLAFPASTGHSAASRAAPGGEQPVTSKHASCRGALSRSYARLTPRGPKSFSLRAPIWGTCLPPTVRPRDVHTESSASRPPGWKVTAMAAPSNLQGPLGVSWPVHLLTLAVPAGIAATFFNGSRFGYHPTLLGAGFLFLMAEGILAAIQAKGKQRQRLLKLHLFLQAAAAAAISAGMWAIYSNKVINGKPHFTTLHGRLGLVALLASAAVGLGGIPAMYGLPKALKKHTASVNKAHKLFGAVSFIGAMVSVLLGLQVTNPGHPLHKGPVTYALALGTLAVAAAVLRSSFALLQAQKALKPSTTSQAPPGPLKPAVKTE